MSECTSTNKLLDQCECRLQEMQVVSKDFCLRFGVEAIGARERVLVDLLDNCLAALDKVPEPSESDRESRSRIASIRGNALAIVADRCQEAIELLSTSTKLNPRVQKTWVSLAKCYYEAGNKEMCRRCLKFALFVGEETKEIVRSLAQTHSPYVDLSASDRNAICEERVSLAQKALDMDRTDVESWFVLGASYVIQHWTLFKYAPVEKAIEAFSKTSPSDWLWYCDYFHSSCMKAYRGIGDVQRMFKSLCLLSAMSLNNEEHKEDVRHCWELLVSICEGYKREQTQEAASSKSSAIRADPSKSRKSASGEGLRPVALHSLETGENPDCVLELTVLEIWKYSEFLCGFPALFFDSAGEAVVVIIRNVVPSWAAPNGALVTVSKPWLHHCALQHNGKDIAFPCVTAFGWCLTVSGEKIRKDDFFVQTPGDPRPKVAYTVCENPDARRFADAGYRPPSGGAEDDLEDFMDNFTIEYFGEDGKASGCSPSDNVCDANLSPSRSPSADYGLVMSPSPSSGSSTESRSTGKASESRTDSPGS